MAYDVGIEVITKVTKIVSDLLEKKQWYRGAWIVLSQERQLHVSVWENSIGNSVELYATIYKVDRASGKPIRCSSAILFETWVNRKDINLIGDKGDYDDYVIVL